MSKSNPRGPWLPPFGTCSCCCPGSCQRWCGHYSGMFTSTSLLNLAIFNEFDLAFKTVRMQLRGTKGGALTVAFNCRKNIAHCCDNTWLHPKGWSCHKSGRRWMALQPTSKCLHPRQKLKTITSRFAKVHLPRQLRFMKKL